VIDQAISTRQYDPYANLGDPYSRIARPFNVSLHEPAAVRYWCRHFNTTSEQLFDAVTKVGSNPTILQLHLRKR